VLWYNLRMAGLFWGKMMKISNTILAVFQLTNEMSAKAAHKFMANLDYIFYVCARNTLWLDE